MGLLNRLHGPKVLLSCADVAVFAAATAGFAILFPPVAASMTSLVAGVAWLQWLPVGLLHAMWWVLYALFLIVYWAPTGDSSTDDREMLSGVAIGAAALVGFAFYAQIKWNAIGGLIESYGRLFAGG
jgi:hypothetical protein